jgi:hypothetical protein
MTATSDLIESVLAPYLLSGFIADSDAHRIIAAIRSDNMPGDTIIALDKSGAMVRLCQRLGNKPDLARMLIASIASRAGSVRNFARNAVSRAGGVTQSGPWTFFTTAAFFDICADLAAASRNLGFSFTTGGTTASAISASKGPFSGVGATGINPSSLSVPLIDGFMMWYRDCQKPENSAAFDICIKYGNPSATLEGQKAILWQSPRERLGQARVLVGQPISSLFPYVYPAAQPSRAQVISAAARKYDLTPQLVAAFLLIEQQDQTRLEDAAEYVATVTVGHNGSIGLGQVKISTARKHSLFIDLLGSGIWRSLSHKAIAVLLASDEFNIFAVARYIRVVASLGALQDPRKLPNTVGAFPRIRFGDYAGHSRYWPRDNIRALASEYTSKPWDDELSPLWANAIEHTYTASTNPAIVFPP